MLWADHLIGRAPEAALRIENASVSWRHASLRWTGRVWELQDLGSLNGTFVDGNRVEPGGRVLLRVGARLRFGDGAEEWVLVDADPPQTSVLALDNGQRIVARDGMIGLPDTEDPEVSVYCQADGVWVAESSERVWELGPDSVVVAGGRPFRFEPGGSVHATSASPLSRPTPATMRLEFVVSRNEEHVELTIVHGERRIPLKPRAHGYMLLTLARLRVADQSEGEVPGSSQGWVEQDRLLKMLATSPAQLALEIYRARRQFGDAGVVGSAQVIERRTSSRELRIGVDKLAIAVA